VFATSVFDQAAACAEQARWACPPNPAVGCVMVNAQGQVLAQGYTQPRGQAHAEVMALRDAALRGVSVQGAIAYVTLEPCSHHGHTPPCSQALVNAGVSKVVVAALDPNPLVAGRGVQMLRDAGMEVEVLPTDSAPARATRELNLGFFSRMERQRSWVRMKIAASLDGQTALPNGQSQWITGEAARTDGHRWRARSCAVLTGIGTVLQDDPLMDVRLVDAPRQPHLVVVDSKLELPLDAKLWSTLGKRPVADEKIGLTKEAINSIAGRALYIYAAVQNDAKKQALEALGATVIYMPEVDANSASPQETKASAKVDLSAMARDLAQREINEVHVEAGYKLNGSLLRAGLVDELLLYTAPKLLGPGMGMANLPELAALEGAMQLNFVSAELLGADLRVQARLQGHGLA
jgi:diaminohydroxyphosphoribosylaminopyrimidine deaminase / 5-amino-6-(5-phosphoribosylamino)uracil reductase